MKNPIPQSINKWLRELELVSDIAFRGIPIKSPDKVTVPMLELMIYDSAKCYSKFRRCTGLIFTKQEAVTGSKAYLSNHDKIDTDVWAAASYIWAHEFNKDISHQDGLKILKSIEARLKSINPP